VIKSVKRINLKYRPASYFWADERGIALVSDIKGAERRKCYERLRAEGEVDEAAAFLSAHALSSEDRRQFGQIHPWCMGGEYLPDRAEHEVEIARITIASTTQDSTCVYASRGADGIHYRVVDEYDGETLSEPNTCTSIKPLTLVELTDFFLGGWDLMEVLDMNFADVGFPTEAVKCFVVDASSSFYAEFGRLVDSRIDRWLRRVRSASRCR